MYCWDKRHGGREGARSAALRHKERLLARLPPPVRIKRHNRRNRSGVIGVRRCEQVRKDGTAYFYYEASWLDSSWRQRSRCFSVKKYGEAAARKLAKVARAQAVARIFQRAVRQRSPKRRAVMRRLSRPAGRRTVLY